SIVAPCQIPSALHPHSPKLSLYHFLVCIPYHSSIFSNLYIASPSFHPPVAHTYSITGLPTTSHTLNASFVPMSNVCRSISTFLILPNFSQYLFLHLLRYTKLRH